MGNPGKISSGRVYRKDPVPNLGYSLVVVSKSSHSEKMTREAVDPFQEINSAYFLDEVRSGNPGCERAFSRLFNRTHSRLTSYLRRYIPDSNAVEDILQETYVAVHRGLPRFESRCKLSTWIFSLAYHKVCDNLAENYREDELRPTHSGALDGIKSKDPLPDTILIQSELIRMIEHAAATLAGKYRVVHFLRDFEGLSGEEASIVLGISPSLVRVRLHRARCLITEKIRSRFPQAVLENPGR